MFSGPAEEQTQSSHSGISLQFKIYTSYSLVGKAKEASCANIHMKGLSGKSLWLSKLWMQGPVGQPVVLSTQAYLSYLSFSRFQASLIQDWFLPEVKDIKTIYSRTLCDRKNWNLFKLHQYQNIWIKFSVYSSHGISAVEIYKLQLE